MPDNNPPKYSVVVSAAGTSLRTLANAVADSLTQGPQCPHITPLGTCRNPKGCTCVWPGTLKKENEK